MFHILLQTIMDVFCSVLPITISMQVPLASIFTKLGLNFPDKLYHHSDDTFYALCFIYVILEWVELIMPESLIIIINFPIKMGFNTSPRTIILMYKVYVKWSLIVSMMTMMMMTLNNSFSYHHLRSHGHTSTFKKHKYIYAA
jgi:hypothetical protein